MSPAPSNSGPPRERSAALSPLAPRPVPQQQQLGPGPATRGGQLAAPTPTAAPAPAPLAPPEGSVSASTKGKSIMPPETSSLADAAAAMSGHSTKLVDAAYAEVGRLEKKARLADLTLEYSKACVATMLRQLELAVDDLQRRKAEAEAAHAAATKHKLIAAELEEKLKHVVSITSNIETGTGPSRAPSGPSGGQSAVIEPLRILMIDTSSRFAPQDFHSASLGEGLKDHRQLDSL
ncbi:hypothetical protein DL771_010077 [Monosporascus sp. 5C6A]|nr:hypothetical protein DL771_010077 [Monosporascus sp. 5C6A]